MLRLINNSTWSCKFDPSNLGDCILKLTGLNVCVSSEWIQGSVWITFKEVVIPSYKIENNTSALMYVRQNCISSDKVLICLVMFKILENVKLGRSWSKFNFKLGLG